MRIIINNKPISYVFSFINIDKGMKMFIDVNDIGHGTLSPWRKQAMIDHLRCLTL